MTDRDRLIELISHKQCYGSPVENGVKSVSNETLAAHLIANGVIVPIKVKGYTDYFIDAYRNVYKDGYYYVQLCENGKRKRVSVHRLVAETFIDNPCNFPMVNHKDENRENNKVNNLEWCTEKYNTNYGNARVKQAKAVSKAVVCIETGEVFCSQKEAGQIIKVAYQHICDCCKGKKQTCGGYHWRYANREEAEKALERSKGNA